MPEDDVPLLKEFVERFNERLKWDPYQNQLLTKSFSGGFIFFLAAIMVVGWIGMMFLVGLRHPGWKLPPSVILLPLPFAAGLWYKGRREHGLYVKAKRLQAMFTTVRRPILFLRSFSTDSEELATGGYFGKRKWSSEEIVCSVFEGVGPVVAMGIPSDRLLRVGALRFYANGRDWQPVVDELLRICSPIILRVGRTSGLLWELQRIASKGYLSKTVFMLIDEHGVPYGKREYEALCENFQKELGISLPRQAWDSSFIGFRLDGTPIVVHSYRPWVRDSYKLKCETQELLTRWLKIG